VKTRIFFKLLGAFLLVIAVTALTLDFAVRRAWESSLYNQIETTLRQKVVLFAKQVEHERNRPAAEIAADVGLGADARATIVDSGGRVLADTRANPQEMENHATRPEFIAAFGGRIGENTRVSHTVGIPFLYVAAPIRGGAVRLAYPLSAIRDLTHQVRRRLAVASGLALALAMLISAGFAQVMARRLRRIVGFAERVAQGDLSARIDENADDEIGQVAGALDRTARKLEHSFAELETSRRQLETLLNSMQDAVLAVSAAGRVEWANGVMQRVAGRVRLDAPTAETVRDPDFLRAVEEVLRVQQVRTARCGSLLPGHSFDVIAAPMAGSGVVAVLHDVTEVERVEKTRRDFIANVSHELRTPLTSVQGYAETLLDSGIDGSTREFLDIIRKNAARMARLTEDLLTLARVESGETEFSRTAISPAGVLRETVQNFAEMARAAGVALSIDDCSTRPVHADGDAIQQVLANLVTNAIKYAASGGRILLGARDVEPGVEFYVQDFGPGIPSEHLPRLFERFYRVDKARSRESGGTGLGLAIAKHIVLAHGGSIRVESALNHGSTFYFELPTASVPATAGIGSR
jgi:two-component system, OmpR family, phosphate regulon sensor histidine kinase PhoR